MIPCNTNRCDMRGLDVCAVEVQIELYAIDQMDRRAAAALDESRTTGVSGLNRRRSEAKAGASHGQRNRNRMTAATTDRLLQFARPQRTRDPLLRPHAPRVGWLGLNTVTPKNYKIKGPPVPTTVRPRRRGAGIAE